MAEVKTLPVTAQHIPDKREFRSDQFTGRVPGLDHDGHLHSDAVASPDHHNTAG